MAINNTTNLDYKGAVAYGILSFPKKIVLASLCPFICLQAVYQLSGPVYKSTWRYFASYSASYLHFIIFSAIATDNRHSLRSVLHTKMLQIADDSFPLYCAG